MTIALALEVEVDGTVSDRDIATVLAKQLNMAGEDPFYPVEANEEFIASWRVKESGYFDASPPAVIVDREWWYVRSATMRGLHNTLEQLEGLKSLYETFTDDTPIFHKRSLEGIASELIQWTMETGQYLSELNERIPRSSDRFDEGLLEKATSINYKYLKGES